MSKIIIVFLILALAGCGDNEETKATGTESKPSAEKKPTVNTLEQLVIKSKIRPKTQFKIYEYIIPGLWDALQVQPFFVEFLSQDGGSASEAVMIYSDGKVMSFAKGSGGFGLMSAVLMDNTLYYTYSYGFGVHRSQIGRLSMDGRNMKIVDSDAYENIDLFLKNVDGRIQVVVGEYKYFFEWKAIRKFGWLKVKDNEEIVIVKDDGTEIVPNKSG